MTAGTMSVFLALHLGWVQNSVFTGWRFHTDLTLLKDTYYVRRSELCVQYKNILFKFMFIFIWQCQLWSVKTLFWSIQSYFYMRNIFYRTHLLLNTYELWRGFSLFELCYKVMTILYHEVELTCPDLLEQFNNNLL